MLGHKIWGKPLQIGVFCVFECILGMKYLNNSEDSEYSAECTHGFSPTTKAVRWNAPDRPHTTHRATAGQIMFKSRPPAGARVGDDDGPP